MGLQAAFNQAHPGERIMCRQNGVLANIKLYLHEDGSFGVRVRRGGESFTSPAYTLVNVAWMASMEHLLRELGVEPDAYHLVLVPDNAETLVRMGMGQQRRQRRQ